MRGGGDERARRLVGDDVDRGGQVSRQLGHTRSRLRLEVVPHAAGELGVRPDLTAVLGHQPVRLLLRELRVEDGQHPQLDAPAPGQRDRCGERVLGLGLRRVGGADHLDPVVRAPIAVRHDGHRARAEVDDPLGRRAEQERALRATARGAEDDELGTELVDRTRQPARGGGVLERPHLGGHAACGELVFQVLNGSGDARRDHRLPVCDAMNGMLTGVDHDDDHERRAGHAARRHSELDRFARAGLGRVGREDRCAVGLITCPHAPTLSPGPAARIA